MRIRSTGLGKQELGANAESVKRNGDYIVLTLAIYEPVKWKVRAALNCSDLFRLVFAMMKGLPSIIYCIAAGSKKGKKFGESSW